MVIPPPQEELLLEMVLPQNQPLVSILPLPRGYRLRQFDFDADAEQFNQLLLSADMGTCRLGYWKNHVLPGGFFVVEDVNEQKLVATCFAAHHPSERHEFAGNLGWLAVDPSHRGKKLGHIAVASVMNRLKEAGYQNIYLGTHPFRLAAIKIYIELGWQPYIYTDDMAQVWADIYTDLKLNRNIDSWKHNIPIVE